MRFIYIISCGFFILLAFFALYNFKRKRIGFQNFLIWFCSFCFLAVLSLFPSLADFALKLLGLKLRTNFLLIVLMIITISFIFVQLNTNSKFNRENTRLTQALGIQRFLMSYSISNQLKPIKKHDVIVKMAAYNEENNIKSVLETMPDNVDVLVIDDGSQDRTGEFAKACGAMIIRHEINLGQGIADLTGFQVAFDMGYKYIIEMDADGQHNPIDIPLFINKLEDHPDLDIVVGSRITGSQSVEADFLRTKFLPLYTRMINWASGYSLTDGMCGFKAYRAESLLKSSHVFNGLIETEYIAAELYIRFGRSNLNVGEIPINVLARASGRSHKGTFRYGFAVAWVIMRALFDLKMKDR